MRKQNWLLIFFYISIISFPYIFAYISSGTMYNFGGFLLNPIDGNTYLAKMYEGWRGEWSFTLPFTAEKGNGAFLFLFYLALGHVSRITGLSLIFIFHVARLIGAVCLMMNLQAFIKWVIGDDSIWTRRVLGIILFGSGLGWLLIPFGLVTSDLWVAEAFPFLSGFANPHFPLGIALILNIFMKMASPDSLKIFTWLVLSSLLVSIIMPFGIAITIIVGVIWLIVEWWFIKELKWKQALAAFLPGGFLLLYQYRVTLLDPLLSKWNSQNFTPSPPAWDFLVAFSPALLFAAWGIWKLIHEQTISNGQRLLITWFFTGLVLIYAPIDLQRRFMFGYFIPVGLLAIEGLRRLPNSTQKIQVLIFRIFTGFSIVTNAVVLVITLFGILSLSPRYYLTSDEVEGFTFIRTATQEDAIVLCSPDLGNYLPGWTGRRVIYGHEFETVDAVKNKRLVEQFYSDIATTEGAISFLKQNHIRYIFVGNREKAIGTPAYINNIHPVFKNSSVSIYEIQ